MKKKAAVLGYGKSGTAAARILKLQGYGRIDFYDDNKAGAAPISDYEPTDYDMTVISPGIPMSSLKKHPGKPWFTSEIELAFKELPMDAVVIGVTGTNGKSTVTHLTAQIINNAGLKAVACGNIGYPFADAVLDVKADVYVVELSSFQIELITAHEHTGTRFCLQSAALTNLTPDHLDRYKDYREYAAAKLGITHFISKDGMLVADAAPEVANAVLKKPYKVRYVDRELESWPKFIEYKLVFDNFFVYLGEFELFGWHNLLNLSFALALASTVVKIEGDASDLIKGLTAMPHRTEIVLEQNGITWIDDSKATNVDSTLMALKSCKFPSIVLLGGKDKHSDYTLLVDELSRAASMVICFGAAADIIYSQLEGKLMFPLVKAANLKGAVDWAAREAKVDGTTVILSPACSSFDEFKNYEERGEVFVKYVKEVAGVQS